MGPPDRKLRSLLAGIATAVVALSFAAAPATARNAYVANRSSNSVSVIDTATNATVGSPITVGSNPRAIAITPDGTRAYVANQSSNSVSVVDTATNATVAPAIAVGDQPFAIAITPDGGRAYVANANSSSVSVIDTATNATVGSPIAVGTEPVAIAITPDGTRAYVANAISSSVSVIDTATNATVGSPIGVGTAPTGIAITPDGARAYVVNLSANSVSVIDTATNATVGSPIGVGTNPIAIAITPDGARAYVTNLTSSSVSVIDTTTNATVGSPIGVGNQPRGVAITPDGARAYVANTNSSSVSVIDTATNATVGSPITVGAAPIGVAITPDQGPSAAFAAPAPTAGSATVFDASASFDPDGTVARYDWDFGDGSQLADGGPTPAHTYTAPGTYTVTLTVTDNEGCSTRFVFSGQTASCNAGPRATSSRHVSVSGATGPDNTPPDNMPPVITFFGDRTQPPSRRIALELACDEACTASVRGRLSVTTRSHGDQARTKNFRLDAASGQLSAGERSTLTLVLPGRAADALTDAFADFRHRHAAAKLRITATDAAGNSSKRKRRIRFVG